MSRTPATLLSHAFCILLAALLAGCAGTPSREQSLIDKGIAALGGAEVLAGVKTARVKGSFRQWEPEQSDVPGGDMRFANETTFETQTDRASRATRTDYVKNFAYPAPRTFTFSEIVTPDAGYVMGIDSNGRNADNMKANPPAHAMSGLRLATSLRELRRTAPGALLADMKANPADVRDAGEIFGQPAVSYRGFIVAFDPATGLPGRIRTLDYDNIWGDVNYDMVLSDWRDAGAGVKIAYSIQYLLNNRLLTDVALSEAQVNGPVDAARLQIPPAALASAPKPAQGNVPWQWVLRRQFIGTYMDSDNVSFDTRGSTGLRLQQLAPGVHQLQGGTHHSLVVEMSNHLVVFDAPVTDAQSNWLVAETKKVFSGKPIRYVVLTHHHMDHAGGVRGLLVDGGALVVGQGAGGHFRRVLSAPWSRNPDLAPRDLSKAQVIEVADKYVINDGKREVAAYLMDSPHAKGTLMGYVPDAKLGFVTDIWSPGVPLPATPNPGLVSVVTAVKKYGLTPDRFAGGHGSTADYAGLVRLTGQ